MANVDLLISVAVWVIGLGMTAAGMEMTIRPPSQEKTHRKWVYRGVFLTLGLLFVVMNIWSKQRTTAREQSERAELERERKINEGNIKYMQGQLDTQNKLLASLTANSDPKQVATVLAGLNIQRSTLKRETSLLCSDMEQWFKEREKNNPPPTIAIPGKATQAENEAQNAYWLKLQAEYYTKFASRTLALLQQYGAKGVDVRMLEQQASVGYMPQNIVLELRSFANRLDDNGNLKQ